MISICASVDHMHFHMIAADQPDTSPEIPCLAVSNSFFSPKSTGVIMVYRLSVIFPVKNHHKNP